MSFRSLAQSWLARLPVRVAIKIHDLERMVQMRVPPSGSQERPVALVATHELSLSGAPRVALDIARVLRDVGYHVVVLAQSDGPMRAEFVANGLTVLVDLVPSRNLPYLRRLAESADIAIANTGMCAPVVSIWADLVPTIWYLHELTWLEDMMSAGRLARPLAGAARIWAGSELCARVVRPFRPDVAVVPYGLDRVEAQDRVAAGPLEVAVFGSLEPRKGQDLALDGLVALPPSVRDHIRLRFYGRVMNAGFSRDLLQRCDGIVEASYDGELNRDGYLDAVRGTDCVLVSSREDTAPLVSIDALSAGRMLLLTRDVGTSAWLTDDDDALIEARATPDAMRILLERAVRERHRAARIGAAARTTFERHFSVGAFGQRVRTEIEHATAEFRRLKDAHP